MSQTKITVNFITDRIHSRTRDPVFRRSGIWRTERSEKSAFATPGAKLCTDNTACTHFLWGGGVFSSANRCALFNTCTKLCWQEHTKKGGEENAKTTTSTTNAKTTMLLSPPCSCSDGFRDGDHNNTNILDTQCLGKGTKTLSSYAE